MHSYFSIRMISWCLQMMKNHFSMVTVIMLLISLFYPSVNADEKNKYSKINTTSPTCPCFSNHTLSFFTSNNTDVSSSCINDTSDNGSDIGIWKIRPSGRWWHSFGYHVYGRHNQASCLKEGDMMFRISLDEAEQCRKLIVTKCINLGLLMLREENDAWCNISNNNNPCKMDEHWQSL